MADKLLTVRETAEVLGLTEKEIIDLVGEGKLPAYKIAGEFLRFRVDQIQQLKKNFKSAGRQKDYSSKERLEDFFYYNDFYILALVIISFVVFFIFKQ
ncbi:MAG: helix-turn-helix domain-containing protein [Candidatus Omnitrophica bacterium]|nr:helix-turn-helix domain-containing protein [Candidatus Omnitrophota bacterium]